MKEFTAIKSSTDFGRVYRQGRSYGNKLLVMYIFERGQDQSGRVGISVSKKVGNSVVRHRVKRQIRELFRTHLDRWKDGYDIVVVARKEIKDKEYASIKSALCHVGRHLNVLIAAEETK